jgi:carboxyl-terminal processing protease
MKYYKIKLLSLVFCLFFCNFVAAQKDKTTKISRNLDVFNSVLRELDLNYVDTLNYNEVVKNGIDYMLGNIDPYTVYMPENELDDLKFMTSGEYAGIGALILRNEEGNVVISEPYEGKPAQKNDVRAGDIILEVDGVNTKGMTTAQVSEQLKGSPNTLIKIKLQRAGTAKPIEKEFMREKITLNSLTYSAEIEDGTAYIILSDFTDHAALEVKTTLNEMNKKHEIKNLILDLRNNGGGLVEEAITILSYFLLKGTTVLTTKGKLSSSNRTYKTPTEPIFPNLNLVVLTNRGTASASEIIAGAVQDLDRGLVIGSRTYGKGLVQSVRPVTFGGYLKVTTAKYYIPSGRCIQAIDYSHRNEDGSVGRVPDSLTSVFYTKNGRIVRDGGGIVPDTLVSDERNINIAYYIYAKNLYFNFATNYVLSHPTIASADKFKVSDEDFDDFVKYLKDKNFTYTSQTEKYFTELKRAAEFDSVDKAAEAEFAALQKKLKPDLETDIQAHKDDICNLLSLEIVKRYYFQNGEIVYSMQTDKELQTALSLLNDKSEFEKLLKVK